MARDPISELLAFREVARECSFTRAAATLGVSPSSLSHTLRALEARLGVRLLSRTTRSVAPTEAGERLMQRVAPRLQEIEDQVASVSELGPTPAGTVRITAVDHAIDSLLLPRLAPFLLRYPDIRVELSADCREIDIVAERFDIGVRWGDQAAAGMVAVPLELGRKQTMVASPAYLDLHGVPVDPPDLLRHNCIAQRLADGGGLKAWELKNGTREMQVHIEGQATFNGAYQMLDAALSGCGIALLPQDLTQPHVEAGRLQSVMVDWCPMLPGLHAYYPSRRHTSRLLGWVIEAIRGRS